MIPYTLNPVASDLVRKYIINVSANRANYSQRNNEFHMGAVKAATECNVTSMCMALDYAGYKFPKGEFAQPEDNLAKFLNTDPRVIAYYKEKMPAMANAWLAGEKDSYPPNEVHAILSYGTNLWIGTKATTFSTNNTIKDLLEDIVIRGLPVVISGCYSKLNHVVVLAGVTLDDKWNPYCPDDWAQHVSGYIYDDPWGKTYEYEKGLSGNDVPITPAQFIADNKPLGNVSIKWAHRISPSAAVV